MAPGWLGGRKRKKNQGWRIEKKVPVVIILLSRVEKKTGPGGFFLGSCGKARVLFDLYPFCSHFLLNTHGIAIKIESMSKYSVGYKIESQGREAFPFFVCLSVVVNGKHFLEREVGGTSVYVLFFMSSNLVRASHLLLSSLYTSLPILYTELFNR